MLQLLHDHSGMYTLPSSSLYHNTAHVLEALYAFTCTLL